MENYTQIWYRIEQIKLEVGDLCDDYLIEEVLHIHKNECPAILGIINNYMKYGRITAPERKQLEWYYVLVWIDDDVEE